MPLINADRMMMSILPEPVKDHLPEWAQTLRDKDQSWMSVAQKGVEAFVAQAMLNEVAFAMETVFSYWEVSADGKVKSKIDNIRSMQDAGYFVLLFFVGLSNVELSIARVQSRFIAGGHTIPEDRLRTRFPKTQQAIGLAMNVADASVFVDNSGDPKTAFTLCRVQIKSRPAATFDIRTAGMAVPASITTWMSNVAPLVGLGAIN